MNVGTPGVAFMRHGPILGSEISLPHFANGRNENPVQFLNLLDDYFLLKATPEFQKLMIIKSALGGSVLSWFQLFIEPGTPYAEFRQIFLSFSGMHNARIRLSINWNMANTKPEEGMTWQSI